MEKTWSFALILGILGDANLVELGKSGRLIY